jgi:hypothetical protein
MPARTTSHAQCMLALCEFRRTAPSLMMQQPIKQLIFAARTQAEDLLLLGRYERSSRLGVGREANKLTL